ncbi:MAG: hypothetical protein HC902_07245, partial [Calothrix sp. SM1_5_4]|nr:hypothetical protein [Calothrix sp. SM1_5_4]
MSQDLQDSLNGYRRVIGQPGTDPSLGFRAMVRYFYVDPSRKLEDFPNDLEEGRDITREVPVPIAKTPPPAIPAKAPLKPVQPRPPRGSKAAPRRSRKPHGGREASGETRCQARRETRPDAHCETRATAVTAAAPAAAADTGHSEGGSGGEQEARRTTARIAASAP